jgi:ubiquinone/menaquinone biosynthesis C-methylase UbiE
MTAEAAFWNDIAEKYSKKPVDNPEAFERKIEITRSRMRPEDVVLDIGCGTGSLALRLADGGREIHGLDFSDEMVRIARGKAKAQGADNVRFHCGPFDETFDGFEDASLNGICAYSILHLVEDRPAALARIYRLLAPGGFFISSTTCLGGSWVPYRPLLAVMRFFGKAPMVEIFSKETLVDEIREAGFVDISEPDVGADSTIAFVVATKPR